MTDIDSTPAAINRKPCSKSHTRRTFHPAIGETDAGRLTPHEIDIFTQALLMLENKVVRKLKPKVSFSSLQRVKQ